MSEPTTMHKRDGRGLFWLLVCFTCSGMSALIYEVAWVRSLELIFGATTFAVATVLAAFMGGLAFGSYFMGRLAHRLAKYHPLKVYAVMECGIGVIALLIPMLFHTLAPLYQAVYQKFNASFLVFSSLRFILCVLILLVPTSLMGATLPIMSNFVNRNAAASTGQRRIGLLYTVNTAGAVLGCLAAGFLLFPMVGLQKTQWIAVGLSSLAALGAFLLSRREVWDAPAAPVAEAASSERKAPTVSREAWLLVTIYAASGFTAMLYEVAWSRLLVQVLGSSTYAYTIMLATFLFGLAGGAWLGTRYLIRASQPLLTIGLCQVVVGLTTFAGIFCIEELPYVYTQLFKAIQPEVPGTMAILFLLSFGLMILPTLGLGAMFPVAIHGLSPSGEKTARVVGWAYSLNTLGAIGGSVAAGFWLLPLLGTQITLLIGIAINALMAAAAFAATRTGKLVRYRYWIAGLLVLFAGNSLLNTPAWEAHTMASGVFRYVRNYLKLAHADFSERLRGAHGEILMFKEGLTCNVIVFRSTTAMSLLVNGKPDASTPPGQPWPDFALLPQGIGDLPTQILLGQIPLVLAPQKEQVMVIGLGSGVTLGSVLKHDVNKVECVELEDAVVQANPLFGQYNGLPLQDPRVKQVVNDARNHLLVTDQKYDVIISEPSNPWIPGAAALFTREFFELARSRLNTNGVFCQWIQLYELHPNDLETILRSLRGVFPYQHIFRVEMDAILLASTTPLPVDYDFIQSRLTPAVRADLAQIKITSVDDLLAHYWVGGPELKNAIPEGAINTDDNMYIEFKAPLRMLVPKNTGEHDLHNQFRDRSTALVPLLSFGRLPAADQSALWGRLGQSALKIKRPLEARNYGRRSLELLPNASAAVVCAEALSQSKSPEAGAAWAEAKKQFPDSPEVLRALAGYYQGQNQGQTNWAEARAAAQRYHQLRPEDMEGRYLLGKSLFHLKDWPGAEAAFGPLMAGYLAHTNWADLPGLVGGTFWQLGRHAEAVDPLRQALKKDYWNFEVRQQLGEALVRLGRGHDALLQWQRLGQLRTSRAQTKLREALQARDKGDFDQTAILCEEAYELDPWDADLVFELVRSRSRRGLVKEAIRALEEHLRWDKDRPWAVGYLGQLYEKTGDSATATAMYARYHSITGKSWAGVVE